MKSNSHSTAERRLRSCLHLGPATGALADQRGCCAPAVPHQVLVLPLPQIEYQGKIQKE